MGTVIIYKGQAFIFDDEEPKEAVEAFLNDWFQNPDTEFQVVPIGGRQEKNGMMSSVSNNDWRENPE